MTRSHCDPFYIGPMGGTGPRTGRRRTAASAKRDAAAERWLLLVALVALLAVAFGFLGPGWHDDADRPDRRPLTFAEARASNAHVPIDRPRRGTAGAFRFVGGPASREQASECLATAALYEAGKDVDGQRAVMQVVLNRVRTPGFPGTVCGVVYQGSTKPTGCQFSFTCDGSFQRRAIHTGWAAARRRARAALAGKVYRPVGRAINYHADWSVPYWRDTMTKVARVGEHVFYVRSVS